ncbi:LOW QUALITY PROTEIN: hypothetical protein CVT26_004452 [Gymnopilus dilepis]|uniref:Uncharacterized protein n=1 Tax=Gymnopilus dilepis TaxID=231916 RepID=A0A409W6T3_9AGAR|nr:LOW QUALITY PROTEIN: hypothetical protein CVT26_004452 [Gymnopilus dilepis]
MSSLSHFVSAQRTLISSEVNSTILGDFLWVSKMSPRNAAIAWAISLSYYAFSTFALMNWYRVQLTMANHSKTQHALFAALLNGSHCLTLVSDLMTFAMMFVAEGILKLTADQATFAAVEHIQIDIWGCYHVSGRSSNVIFIPGSLLFYKIGKYTFLKPQISIVEFIVLGVIGVDQLDTSRRQSDLCNHLHAVQTLITLFVTLYSSAFIAYRIYTTLIRDILRNYKRPLIHSLDILVQSGATYSVAVVVLIISNFILQTTSSKVSWLTAGYYTPVLFVFISVSSHVEVPSTIDMMSSLLLLLIKVAGRCTDNSLAMLDENDIYGSNSAFPSSPLILSGSQLHLQSTQDDVELQPPLSEKSRGLEPWMPGVEEPSEKR